MKLNNPGILDGSVTHAKLAHAYCVCRVTAATVVPTGIQTPLAWALEDTDTADLHDTVINNSRITVPTGYSLIRLSTLVSAVPTANGTERIRFRKNGADFNGGCNHSRPCLVGDSQPSLALTTGWLTCVAGDYFEVFAIQLTGVDMNMANSTNDFFAAELWK